MRGWGKTKSKSRNLTENLSPESLVLMMTTSVIVLVLKTDDISFDHYDDVFVSGKGQSTGSKGNPPECRSSDQKQSRLHHS